MEQKEFHSYIVQKMYELGILFDKHLEQNRLKVYAQELINWDMTKQEFDYIIARLKVSFKADYGVKFPLTSTFHELRLEFWEMLRDYNREGKISKSIMREKGIPYNLFPEKQMIEPSQFSDEQKQIRIDAQKMLEEVKRKLLI